MTSRIIVSKKHDDDLFRHLIAKYGLPPEVNKIFIDTKNNFSDAIVKVNQSEYKPP
jgi:hypothetical protein